MAKGLTVGEQTAIRENWYHVIAESLQMANETDCTKIAEGLAVSDDMADVVIKVIVKKERIDFDEQRAILQQKEEDKLTKEQQKLAKKEKDAVRRQKLEEAKALLEKVRKGEDLDLATVAGLTNSNH